MNPQWRSSSYSSGGRIGDRVQGVVGVVGLIQRAGGRVPACGGLALADGDPGVRGVDWLPVGRPGWVGVSRQTSPPPVPVAASPALP
jgi:hypothetical protein